jgi:hypothetical protein
MPFQASPPPCQHILCQNQRANGGFSNHPRTCVLIWVIACRMSHNATRARNRALAAVKTKLLSAIESDNKLEACLVLIDRKGDVSHLGTALFDGWRVNPGPDGMMQLVRRLPQRRPTPSSASWTSFQSCFQRIKYDSYLSLCFCCVLHCQA